MNIFDEIVSDILINNRFKELDKELHHGITRAGHSMRVAKCTFYVTKKLNMNYKDATRAALLHDFYNNNDTKKYSSTKTLSIHPSIALKNAKEEFDLSKLQENIIESHMFPLGKIKPKYKEAWIVTCIDKSVAIYEMAKYKLSLKIGIYILFAFNMLTIQR